MTSNDTYASWATKVYDWTTSVKLIDSNYNVFDGADAPDCTDTNTHQWSYNLATYLYGAAVMQSYTGGNSTWVDNTNGLLNATSYFFVPPEYSNANIMYEPDCEFAHSCNSDQLSFKSYLALALAVTSVLAPSTAGKITPLLQASAQGAGAACSGRDNACGTLWYIDGTDNTSGLGQQLCAMDVMLSLLAW